MFHGVSLFSHNSSQMNSAICRDITFFWRRTFGECFSLKSQIIWFLKWFFGLLLYFATFPFLWLIDQCNTAFLLRK